jgi:hypothetical protein
VFLWDIWRSELEKGHGRTERPEVLTSEDIGWLSGKKKWANMKTIILYRGKRTEKGEKTNAHELSPNSSALADLLLI